MDYRGPHKIFCEEGFQYYLDPSDENGHRPIQQELPMRIDHGQDLVITQLTLGQPMNFHSSDGVMRAYTKPVTRIQRIYYCDCSRECAGCETGNHCYGTGCWMQ